MTSTSRPLRRPGLQSAADELLDRLRAHTRHRLDDDVALLLIELTLTESADKTPDEHPWPIASVTLSDGHGTRSSIAPDLYHWTEQFGLNLKISGPMRCTGKPEILDGDPSQDSALLRWRHADGSYTAAALNYPVPVAKLKRLGARTAQLVS